MRTSIKISWILWWVVTALIALLIVGLVIYAFYSGLSTWKEVYILLMLIFGVFLIPAFLQIIWLIVNLMIGSKQKYEQKRRYAFTDKQEQKLKYWIYIHLYLMMPFYIRTPCFGLGRKHLSYYLSKKHVSLYTIGKRAFTLMNYYFTVTSTSCTPNSFASSSSDTCKSILSPLIAPPVSPATASPQPST